MADSQSLDPITAANDLRSADITVDDLDLTYQARGQDIVALSQIDLSIGAGTLTALIGPSGCGKSTLLNVIAGLIRPTSGKATISDIEISKPIDELGMVFQKDLLLDWRNVLDNVLLQYEARGLAAKPHREKAKSLLGSMGLVGFESTYPYELSGGMRQRVAIARALIHSPKVLLLDEPFSALDAFTKERLQADVQTLWSEQRPTTILVTHDIDEAVRLAQRVVIMTPSPGKVHEIVDIDLPYPRTFEVREGARFRAYVQAIHETFSSLGIIKDDE